MKTQLVSIKEIGEIREIRKSIVKVDGLSHCMTGQLVNFEGSEKGFIMGFNENGVLALLLGNPDKLKAGDKVYTEIKPFRIPVGKNYLGRMVNPLCEPLDGKEEIKEETFYDVFREAPGVLDRAPVEEMLETGIRIVDSMLPIGKGQRELIIGDRLTGKTSIATDAILNQKGKKVVCIYCCIGRDYPAFEKVVNIFKRHGALNYLIIVVALGSAPIGEQYLAPYTAVTLGEYFMHSGRDVLVVFDDLTKHAWAYRELSLLLERPPGREAFPGDIFYLHAQLMERAAKLSKELGGGSMTFFPIADTIRGDIAGFIPTNLISMTDGQIYLSSGLFNEGLKPAVDLRLSVSRIGDKVQPNLMRQWAGGVGLRYIQYRDLLKATKLRAAVSEDVEIRLKRGEKIEQIFIQEQNRPSPLAEQLVLFYALRKGLLDYVSDSKLYNFKKTALEKAKTEIPDIAERLGDGKELSDLEKQRLEEFIIGLLR